MSRRDKGGRRRAMFWMQMSIAVAVNSFWLPGIWGALDAGFRIYYSFLVQYAFRKTRICPVEIMRRTDVLRWPRSFRMMYRHLAVRMMLLYFPAALLVLCRCGYCVYRLVFLFCH